MLGWQGNAPAQCASSAQRDPRGAATASDSQSLHPNHASGPPPLHMQRWTIAGSSSQVR
jgi:hypothetical protein